MTVAQRLYLLILSTVVGLFSLAGFNMYQMDKVYTATNYANVNTVPSLLVLDEGFRSLAQLRMQVWQYMALKDPAKRAEMAQTMNVEHAKVIAALNKYEKEDISDDKDRSLLAADRSALAEYDALREKVLELANADKADEARDLLLGNQAVFAKLGDTFEAHRQFNAELGKKGAEDAASVLKNSNWFAVIITFLAAAAVAGMGLMLARKIVKSLHEAVRIAQMVAAGDLTARIEVTSKDETGQVLQALKDMNSNLVNIVGQVRSGTDTIAIASSQIAAGNLDLSSRTEQQASALEETASSMEELTSTVRQNADNARQANQLAASASDVALKGGAVVAQVVQTMGSINDSSNKIADIISVIDGIAFQTNILALNAAVEAARAGEQGRGFAVVATEVRNLAQRSAAAAKEIKALITDSVEKVGIGSKLVDQAGATMEEVVESVRRVTDVMSEITAASHEQSSGIDQINQAVTQMDEVTQQNAALVEEAAAAAASLQEQADNLAQVVSVFKLDGMHAAANAPLKMESRPLRATTAAAAPITAANRAAKRPAIKVTPLKRVANAPVAADEWEEF